VSGTSFGKIRFLCSSVSGLANKPNAKTFMIVLLVQKYPDFAAPAFEIPKAKSQMVESWSGRRGP
jgi:hypothetical protein